jgi:signal transduction histidine kinase
VPDLRPLLRTSTFRLTLAYLGVVLASVIGILAVVTLSTAHLIDRHTVETVAAETAGLMEQYREQGLSGLGAAVARRSAVPGTDLLFLLAAPELEPIAGNLSRWPEAVPERDGWIGFTIGESGDGSGRQHEARAQVFALRDGYQLLVGRSMRDAELLRDKVILPIALGVVLTLALGAAGGLAMSRSVLHRVSVIGQTARRIMRGALPERIPLRGTQDEFDHLAGNLNDMLNEIERLMEGMRQITDSIAHDLRTPLTRMRSRIEMTLLERPDVDTARAALQENLEEVEQLLATFTALMNIAQVEAGTLRSDFQPVALAPLVRRLAELYEPLAEDQELAFELALEGEPSVHGNVHLLSQAVANLVDNAIKYTPAGGRIVLSVRPGSAGRGAELAIADSGPGIPVAARAKVLERFVRLEPSRSSPGSGLGLSLVDAVARLHRATLILDDNAPGLRARLIFPVADDQDVIQRPSSDERRSG